MKHIFTTFALLWFLVGSLSAIGKPLWLKHSPRHNDPTNYYLYIAHGKAMIEDDALLSAERDALKQAYGSTGATKNATIRHARYTYYATRDKDGFISVYCLYIIANTAENFKNAESFWGGVPNYIKKEPIRNISPTKSKRKPQYWDNFKGTSYLSEEGFASVNDIKEIGRVTDSLYMSLEQKLIIDKNAIPDSSIVQQILHQDSYWDKKEKVLYATVYVRKSDIAEQYTAIIEGLLQRAETYVNNAIEKESVPEEYQEWLKICSLYENAQMICDSINNLLPKLQQYVSNRDFDTRKTNLTHTITMNLTNAKIKSQAYYISNLQDWLKIAYEAETNSKQIATALEYYYASYVYWGAKNSNTDTIKLTSPANNKIVCLTRSSLKKHIVEILKSIQIHCVRQNNTEINLYFYAGDGAVANMAYWYNTGSGENRNMQFCQDGVDVIEMRDNKGITHMHVRIDFRATDLIGDNVLKDVVRKFATSDRELDQAAKQNSIKIEDKLSFEMSHPTSIKPTMDHVANNINTYSQTYLATPKDKIYQLVEISDPNKRQPYENIIAKVCDGINKNDLEALRSCFSDNGFLQLKKMVFQTPVKVRSQTSYTLVSCMDEVYVRSIPITIRYKNRNNNDGDLKENLVFVFDSTMHIDGIQFALDGNTANTIMRDQSIDLISRYAIVNFLENYRTAYALKRLDYIRDVFADDAVFIIGRVLSKIPRISDGYDIQYGETQTNIRYTHPDKNQYLKCLERNFKANEWINIAFTSATIEQPNKAIARYGMNLRQEYSSQHYSDDGYLYLIVDLDSQKRPVIHLRAWTPDGKFGFPDYEKLLKK